MSDTSTAAPERDQEVLGIFIEESLEGLARVERLLLEAERGQPASDLFTQVFRDVHTIKGTSGYLSLPKILALSHAGEDLLSKLREDPSKAKPEHFSHMLVVVDLLRRMVERVRNEADEGPDPIEALVARLEAQVAAVDQPVGPVPVLVEPAQVFVPLPSAPPPEKEAPAEDTRRPRAESADGTVRVSVGVLDRLMNLMGELVLARNQIVQILKASRDTNGQAVCQRLSLVTSEMQEQIMKTRMQPVARVFEKIPRQVRDLSQATAKRVSCTVDGTATEIDKAVVEAIRDPVMHAVRNSIDHGIEAPAERLAAGKPEAGMLSVRAFHEAGTVTIEIADDGRGIDPKKMTAHALRKGLISAAEAGRLGEREAVELIFRPGFSTAEQVTQISGRGVGMDVVRTQVERAGGQVEIDSVVGRGTVLRMKMPLTLAIIPALMVRSGEQRFAIPQVNLTELVHLQPDQVSRSIERVRGSPVYRLRGEILPLVDLAGALGTTGRSDAARDGVDIVVVEAGPCRYGLVVDGIHDTEEIVIKPLHGSLKRLSCYAGATVLGDGGVALILEIAGLAALAGLSVTTRRETVARPRGDAGSTQTLLVFTVGGGVPCAVPLSMVTRLERVRQSAIEQVAGSEVVQYRNHLMPVVRPEQVLPLGEAVRRDDQQLLVFDFGRVVALAVDEILDVTTVELTDESFHAAEPFTQGKVVAFGRTTLILDAFGIVRARVPDLIADRRRGDATRPVVLVADAANALRAAVCGHLRTKGFDVKEVASLDALQRAFKAARAGSIAAVVLDSELEGTTDGFVEALKREQGGVPVLFWGPGEGDARRAQVLEAGAAGWVTKLDRDEVARKMEELTSGQRRRGSDHGQPKARAA
ncbi:MAG: chemotaxis protein CheW [Archangium sp.]|nr:chemotaxis protein CheW [Archangium sp.]